MTLPTLIPDVDVIDQIAALRLEPVTGLATYLKNSYGRFLPGMTDELWLLESRNVLVAVATAIECDAPDLGGVH